jgi:hypothetical protein
MVKMAAAEVPVVVETVTLALPIAATRAAGTSVVNSVALMNVVVSGVVPKITRDPLRKFVPFTVKPNDELPSAIEFGLKLPIAGSGKPIVNFDGKEVPPPVVTVTFAVPGVAIRLAGTVTVNWLALTNSGVSAVEFQLTVAAETKLMPLIVSGKEAPPAGIELGLKLSTTGCGALIVKVVATELPVLVVTVTYTVPGVAISPAGIEAVICVVLTTVVAKAVVPQYAIALESK